MPEELPVPEKSLKQLAKEKNEQKKIKNQIVNFFKLVIYFDI